MSTKINLCGTTSVLGIIFHQSVLQMRKNNEEKKLNVTVLPDTYSDSCGNLWMCVLRFKLEFILLAALHDLTNQE